MLDKPQDVAIMFALIAFVVVTMGFGIASIEEQGAYTDNTTFFSDVKGEVTATTGLKGTADEASKIIDPSSDQVQTEATEEGIITQGLQSLRSIGGTFNSVKSTVTDGGKIIGLDPIYISIFIFTILIMFFVIVYTWARGR